MILFTCLILWIHFLEGVIAADRCYNWYYQKTYYCEYGCCGVHWERGCCSIGGITFGACLAGLVLIAFIITAVCFCIKQKRKPGRVSGTTRTTTTSVAVVGQSNYTAMPVQSMGYIGQTYGQPYLAGRVPPPAYSELYPPGPPPTAGMYYDPTYPPSKAPLSYK